MSDPAERNDIAGVVFDEAWMQRQSITLVSADDPIVLWRLTDPYTNVSHLAVGTTWAADSYCKQLEHEFNLRDRLSTNWAMVPSALIRSPDGPVLVYVPAGATAWLESVAAELPSIADFLRGACAVANALSRLHEAHLLHCGLSPASLAYTAGGQVRLRSFGLAVDLATQSPRHLIGVSGAPAYTPPEQSRPESWHVDERSDLYALGIVLVERLTGKRPLNADTRADWLHAHLAVKPDAPSLARADVPPMLDAILLKLIAKEPNERYQSAESLRDDLTYCLQVWNAQGTIAKFPLGQDGLRRRIIQPDALFGRDEQCRLLADIYMRAARAGSAEIILLSGPAGAGKTALAVSLQTMTQQMSAPFTSGKPDQYQPATPYAPVVQALSNLVVSALQSAGLERDSIHARLLATFGGQNGLLNGLVPECEKLIGPRPVPELAVSEVPARVQRALLEAFQAFAAGGAPIVLFIDDLQWVDEATIGFIEMIARSEPANMVLLGALRDDESSHSPRFREFLDVVERERLPVSLMALPPLTETDLRRFVAASLQEPEERIARLASTIHARTGGNVFYANQLLRSLVDEKMIQYDVMKRQWSWNANGIYQHVQPDNVVDLLITRLARLPPYVQEMLRLLACIGVRSDEQIVCLLSGRSSEVVAQSLAAAEAVGLILFSDGQWIFPHDRVQEAAYALTAEDDRTAQHARTAAAMLTLWRDRLQDSAFDIASQIVLAQGATIELHQRDIFASALVIASGRAMAAASRTQALAYLMVANRILGVDRWADSYAMARRVAILRCECLLAIADLQGAASEIDEMFEHMATAIDQAEAHRLKAALLTVGSRYREATKTALAGLALLGVELPFQPTPAQVSAAYVTVKDGLAGRPITHLIDLPRMADPQIEATMGLLTALEATMFYPSKGLMLLHFAKMVELTLQYGVTGASVQGLAWLGVSIAHEYDAPEEGLAYAQVALALVERHGFDRYRTATLVALDQVSVWSQSLSHALAYARGAKAAGNQSAELRWLCYSCNHIISDLLVMGEDLAKVEEEVDLLVAIARDTGYEDIVGLVSTQAEFVRTLRGGYDKPVGAWETAYARQPEAERAKRTPMSALLFWTYLLRGEAAFLFGDLEAAAAALHEATPLTWATPAHINLSDFHLYSVLTATQSAYNPAAQASALESARVHRARFAKWAECNPETFRNKLDLIDAELARLNGDHVGAMKRFELAADAAVAAGFVHEQALAHELAARHAAGIGLAGACRHHLRLARACYRRWGAVGKVRQLDSKYPFLATGVSASGATLTIDRQDDLDIAVVMRTAQALSEEIVLERLIEKLMTSLVVHAGAQHGLLLLTHHGVLRIEATGSVIDSHVSVEIGSTELEESRIPLSILDLVVQSHKPVVFADAGVEGMPLHAASLALHPARSLMCLPLLKQGALVGVLYLENNLARDVFSPKKATMLEVLGPQLANSLEAARLYAELREENARRQETEAALRAARADLARTSNLIVMGELSASIAHEINQPLAGIVSSAGASLRWLRTDPPNLAEALANLEDIRNAGLRAADIVRALRALAKQTPTNLQPVDIDRLIRSILTLTQAEIEAKRVRLTSRLNAEAVPLLADSTQLQQVVLNLVTNALDAMAQQNGIRELVITSGVRDGSIVVSVQDTGSGISEDIIRRIFDPFFTTKKSGMGMGLAICRSIVESHGGKLEAVGGTRGGSSFILKLPVASAVRVTPVEP